MGNITSVIVTVHFEDRDTAAIHLDKFFEDDEEGFGPDLCARQRASASKPYGGGSALQAEIYVGAFKNLDDDRLVRYIDSVPWRFPQSVRILMQGEHEACMRVIR